MIDVKDLNALRPEAQAAIAAAQDRLARAVSLGDTEDVLGRAKDMIESVAKVVTDQFGKPLGSNAKLRQCAKRAIEALGEDGSAFLGRDDSFTRLTSSLITGMEAIGSLRNSDGTGHGRATSSSLDHAHALFVRDAAICWSRWLLATTTRVLQTRAAIDLALANIEGRKSFRRDQLPQYLVDLGLVQRAPSDQRRLGIAVARRWRDNRTFMPVEDVIEPTAEGLERYPSPFVLGLIDGLLFDSNGFLRLTQGDAERVVGLSRSLPAADLHELEALSEACDDAVAAPGYDGSMQHDTVGTLRGLRDKQENLEVAAFVQSIITRIESFRTAPDASG